VYGSSADCYHCNKNIEKGEENYQKKDGTGFIHKSCFEKAMLENDANTPAPDIGHHNPPVMTTQQFTVQHPQQLQYNVLYPQQLHSTVQHPQQLQYNGPYPPQLHSTVQHPREHNHQPMTMPSAKNNTYTLDCKDPSLYTTSKRVERIPDDVFGVLRREHTW